MNKIRVILTGLLVFTLVFGLPFGVGSLDQKWQSDKVDAVADALNVNTYAAAKKATVTFKANGGKIYKNYSNYSSVKKKVKKGKKLGSYKKPERYNYVFIGWYTKKSGGTKYTKSTKVKKNKLTLYARWAKKYPVIKFNPMGGEFERSSDSSKTVTYKSKYGSLPVPTRFDYDFIGWYTAKSGGKKIGGSTKVTTTKNQTLYAQWKVKSKTYLADMTQYEWTGHSTGWGDIVEPGKALEDNHDAIHSYGAIGDEYTFDYKKNFFLSPNTVTYDVEGKYKRIEGIWGLYHNDNQKNGKSLWVKIYGDEKLLYTTPSVTNGSSIKPFSVDITGVKYLKFELCHDFEPSFKIAGKHYYIYDPILYR